MFKFLPNITTSIYVLNVSMCTSSYLWCNWNHYRYILSYRNKLLFLWFDFECIWTRILFPNIDLPLNNFLQGLSQLKWHAVKYRQWLETKNRKQSIWNVIVDFEISSLLENLLIWTIFFKRDKTYTESHVHTYMKTANEYDIRKWYHDKAIVET